MATQSPGRRFGTSKKRRFFNLRLEMPPKTVFKNPFRWYKKPTNLKGAWERRTTQRNALSKEEGKVNREGGLLGVLPLKGRKFNCSERKRPFLSNPRKGLRGEKDTTLFVAESKHRGKKKNSEDSSNS